MAWTSPRTWTTGELVTASIGNTHWRDNLLALIAKPFPMFGADGDFSAEVNLQAMQLVNEIKGWPPLVQPDADLNALNLWWDQVGTPSTAPTVVDVAGEAGITETYELALKVIADGAGEGLSQTWTYADEPRVKSGRVMSCLLAIWSVSSLSVTAKLVNSDASETAASATTAAAWTIVAVENHTLAGTSCSLQVTAAAGTFYVVPLGANIGAKALALAPRSTRYVDVGIAGVVSSVDPGGASWTDVDLTGNTSPLACMVQLVCEYKDTTNANRTLYVRRNGDSQTGNMLRAVTAVTTADVLFAASKLVALDDGQIFEYDTDAAAGDTESVYISVSGYWEWA